MKPMKPKVKDEKRADCYCHECRLWVHHLGIASHRAAHRNRNEDVTIRYKDGHIMRHMFSEWNK
jgi:hypothetical protein